MQQPDPLKAAFAMSPHCLHPDLIAQSPKMFTELHLPLRSGLAQAL